MTQPELAELSGLGLRAIQGLEAGHDLKGPTGGRALKIALAASLHVPYGWLWDGEPSAYMEALHADPIREQDVEAA